MYSVRFCKMLFFQVKRMKSIDKIAGNQGKGQTIFELRLMVYLSNYFFALCGKTFWFRLVRVRVYLSENEKSGGFIQLILDCSILDAKEIHAELIQSKVRVSDNLTIQL